MNRKITTLFLLFCFLSVASLALAKDITIRKVLSQEEAASVDHEKYKYANHRDKKPEDILVTKKAFLATEDIKDMIVITKDKNVYSDHPAIDIFFNKKGTEKLKKLTVQMRTKQIAILIENKVYMTPYVVYPLTKGHFRLSSWLIPSNRAAEKIVKQLGFDPKNKK